ncbi:8845_t:CDS:2 [Diversispora eburnea]|uniref:8845_t:CDS:1 n=1 Tax=Diversispora eburnea TaxID=1213867 RepID=A0A9N8Z387_9GLOM|nr:8845_t:CDS:2 [Diversispora eburnea]
MALFRRAKFLFKYSISPHSFVVKNIPRNGINYNVIKLGTVVTTINFPAWLDGLGIKPLAPLFKGKSWEEIASYSIRDIEVMGVVHRELIKRLNRHLMKAKNDTPILERTVSDDGNISKITDAKYNVKEGRKALVKLGIDKPNMLIQAFRLDANPLVNFPAWLEGLGLKPLASRFKSMIWKDIIKLRSEELEGLGIYNTNIRRRLIKHFLRAQRDLAVANGQVLPVEKIKEFPKMEDIIQAPIDFKILEDVPCWLHSIRDEFGKFAPFFEGKNWKEIINLSKNELKEMGIFDFEIRNTLHKGLELQKQAFVAQSNSI